MCYLSSVMQCKLDDVGRTSMLIFVFMIAKIVFVFQIVVYIIMHI